MIAAVSMVKDEADFIERSVSHMLEQVDHVIVADNGSADGTREILERLDVQLLDEPRVGYYQSERMTELAAAVRALGADWVIPFDADELWIAAGRVGDVLAGLPEEAMICEALILNHVATGDPEMPWRRCEALPLRKVACRATEGLVIHQGNHGASFDGIETPLSVTGRLEVRHFPYRSGEQFVRKARNGAAAYAATALPEDVGKHWRDYGRLGDQELLDVFHRWFFSTDPESDPELVYDPCV